MSKDSFQTNIQKCVDIANKIDKNMLDAISFKSMLYAEKPNGFYDSINRVRLAPNAYNIIEVALAKSTIMSLCRIWDKEGSDRLCVKKLLKLLEDKKVLNHFYDQIGAGEIKDEEWVASATETANNNYQFIKNKFDEYFEKDLHKKIKNYRDHKIAHSLTEKDSEPLEELSNEDLECFFDTTMEIVEKSYLLITGVGVSYADAFETYKEAPEKFYSLLYKGIEIYNIEKQEKIRQLTGKK